MDTMKHKKRYKIAGYLLVILGLSCNEIILGYHLTESRVIQTTIYRVMILVLEIALIYLGIVLLRGKAKAKFFGLGMGVWVLVLALAVCFMCERTIYALVYPSTQFQIAGELINRVDTEEKVVALSFDDGPIEPYTLEVLDVLDRHNVKATFFMVGENIEENMDIAKTVHRKGHQLGNHTYSHRKIVYFKPSKVRYELESTTALLKEIGVNDEIMFRPPYGEKFIVLPMILKSMKMKNIMWDVEPKDWSGRPSDEVVEHVVNHTKSGSIILMHDMQPDAAHSTDLIIKKLKAKGYQFKTVSELLKYGSHKKIRINTNKTEVELE